MADSRSDAHDAMPLASPYGPQHGHVDDAAGGADSSPFENDSTFERREAAQEDCPPAQREANKRK